MLEVAGDLRDREQLPPECGRVRDLIYARAEGEELSDEDLAALEVHLAECEECKAEQRRVRTFTTNISDLLRTLRPAQDLRKKVLDKIESTAERRRTWKPFAALGASVFLALVVLIASRERPSAMVTASSGSPRLMRVADGEHREESLTPSLRRGDRLRLAAGDSVTIETGDCALVLTGPSLAQFDWSARSPCSVHLLAESNLDATAGKTLLTVVIGQLSVRSANARFEISARRNGSCSLSVKSGQAFVNSPLGNTRVRSGVTVAMNQDGSPADD